MNPRKNISLIRVLLMISLGLVFGLQFTGCSESEEGVLKENQPPTIWLSSAPPEGSVEGYVIRMFWGGWDPDGEVAFYQYAITDNGDGAFDPEDTTGADKWSRVISNDSIFSFSADELVDPNTNNQVSDFASSHTFFIRSVDEEGLASKEPAYRSFTAFTLSPKVEISIPNRVGFNPANVPPITTFRWKATDYISDSNTEQDPDSVSWLLEPLIYHNKDWAQTIAYVRNLPVDDPRWDKDAGGWVWYGAPEDSGKFWTTPPKDFGNYLFAIRAKDEAGAITPVFDEEKNMRRILVSRRTTGPLLTLTNQYMGNVGTAVCNTPLTILDLPAGVPIEFSWTANASSYGGMVSGYRYGWDINDLNDPEQWTVDYTPFPPPLLPTDNVTARLPVPVVYFFGTHVFTLEVVDNSGFCSRIEVKINIIQFTMAESLFLVDDFTEGDQGGWLNTSGKGILPNDEEHDQFWLDMLANLDGFNDQRDILEVATGAVIPLTRLANYKSMIWSVLGHVDQTQEYPVLYDLIAFVPKEGDAGGGGKRQPNLIALFLAAGGHLMICGQHPVSMSINDTYAPGVRFPVMFKYEMDLRGQGQDTAPDVEHPDGDQSFGFFELCLETMEFADTDFIRRRGPGLQCPNYKLRVIPAFHVRDQTMRAGIPLDPDFPRIYLRLETAGPGKWHAPGNRGLDCEVYNPQYFMAQAVCRFTPRQPRDCFQPIYGLECFDTGEPTYRQPVAFYSSVFGDKVAGAAGAVAARSVVFGFPPVLFSPDELDNSIPPQIIGPGIRAAIENILFSEWQLPVK
jgi:hypothetical protein